MKVRVTDRGPDGVARRWATSDSFNIDASKRQMTPEGFMVVPGKISRTGIQEYDARELGIEGTDRTVRLYRPPEEVFKDSTLASFENVPITSGHPEGDGVDANNFRSVASGVAYDCQRSADSKTTNATLKFMAGDAIDRVIAGQDQLSCGYSFRMDMTPGTSPEGEAYDGVMRDIEGNHVAHVWNARGGPGLRVADEDRNRNSNQETPMKIITIDGIQIEVADGTTASLIEKTVKEANQRATDALAARDTAVTARTVAETALAAATAADATAKAAHVAQIAELTAKIPTADAIKAMVADLASVTADARKILGDNFTGEGKDVAGIRVAALESVVAAKDEHPAKAMLAKILGDKKPSDLSPEIAKLAFDGVIGVLAAGAPIARGTSAATAAQAAAFAPAGSAGAGRATDAKEWTGEEIYSYRKTHGGKNPPGFDAN